MAATRYRMVFPIAGPRTVLSVFGAERDGGERTHKGVDLAAPKLTPVVAVKDGTVVRLNRAGVSVVVKHDDGWSSWYVHLNDDTFGTDDGLGVGILPGLEVGSRVSAGQVIGWIGDSGNAERTPPHLHFELRTPWGEAIDPLRSLRASWWVDEEVPSSFAGAFWDDDETPIAPLADLMVSMGLLTGCDPLGLQLCPDQELTGEDLEGLLREALDLDVDPGSYLPYDWDPVESAIRFTRFSSLEQALGCNRWVYCPDQPLSRGELAAVVAGALELEPVPSALYYSDLNGHFAAGAVNALVQAEVLHVCRSAAPGPFDPEGIVTRAEAIELLARALGLISPAPCRLML